MGRGVFGVRRSEGPGAARGGRWEGEGVREIVPNRRRQVARVAQGNERSNVAGYQSKVGDERDRLFLRIRPRYAVGTRPSERRSRALCRWHGARCVRRYK